MYLNLLKSIKQINAKHQVACMPNSLRMHIQKKKAAAESMYVPPFQQHKFTYSTFLLCT